MLLHPQGIRTFTPTAKALVQAHRRNTGTDGILHCRSGIAICVIHDAPQPILMHLQVETRAPTHADPEPCAFNLGNRRLAVTRIVDRWIAADHSYFKLTAEDGNVYILRHDQRTSHWELTLFQNSERDRQAPLSSGSKSER